MKFQIKSRWNSEVLFEIETGSIKLALEIAVKSGANLRHANLGDADLRDANLRHANLRHADLGDADLGGANLGDANLGGANLRHANLWDADLRHADLGGANLRGANLRHANLWDADLRGADLRDANLRHANLWDADLRDANLWDANLCFGIFPSIKTLASISLQNLPDVLTLELMRRDAYNHPKPELFDIWAKGGNCPYQNEERFWLFKEKKKLWKKGKPQMTDRDLTVEICKSQGWKIKNYLE